MFYVKNKNRKDTPLRRKRRQTRKGCFIRLCFFAKTLPNRIKAGLLTCPILYAFPKFAPVARLYRIVFRAYSCATVREFHTVPFSFYPK
jgi:hypothetical protein